MVVALSITGIALATAGAPVDTCEEGAEWEITSQTLLAENIYECAFDSIALAKEMKFSVLFPTGYTPDGPAFPVVYLLHGAGRTHLSLIDDDVTRPLLQAASFVTVMPNGGTNWWIDSHVVATHRYQSFITETIQVAEDNFNVKLNPEGRGLAGWSMGGFGLFSYAVRYPGKFSVMTPIIGVLDFPNDEYATEWNHSVPSFFGATIGEQEQYNPFPHIEQIRGMKILHITSPTAFDFQMNNAFDQRLTQLGIGHTYNGTMIGGHSFTLVQNSIPQVVAFQEQYLEPRKPESLAAANEDWLGLQ